MTATTAPPARRRTVRVRPPMDPAETVSRPAGRSRAVTSLPFIALIASILGGGLLALLMVNNSLAAGSFAQARLRAEQVALFEQEQALRQEVQRLSSPTVLRSTAKQLGMLPAATTAYIDIGSGRILGKPTPAGGSGDPAADPTAEAGAAEAVGGPLAADAGDPLATSDPSAAADPTADGAGTGTEAPGGDGAAAADAAAEAPAGAAAIPPPVPGDNGDGAALGGSEPLSAYDRAVVTGGVDR